MTAQRKPQTAKPVLFDPNWEKPPIFFLHIPKTAGSSNNQFLRGLYGPGNFHAHTENILPDLTDGRRAMLRVDCISGHIPLWAWCLYKGSEHFARVTLLRDPWARVVSHINWVNLFNHGVALPKHGPGAADLAKMVEVLAVTDFQNRNSLLALLDAGRQMRYFTSFDNYQVRMLRWGAMDAMEKRLTAGDVEVSCDALQSFFHFGFCDDQPGFQNSLLQKLHLPGQAEDIAVNPGRCKVLKTDNDLAREILSPWFEMDQALVGYARGLQAARSQRGHAAASHLSIID